MMIIGITGGIGSGKSTVSAYLKENGYPIIDADEISRNITALGSPVLDDISDLLGRDVIKADGSLNRKLVAALIFDDENLKKRYEKLVFKSITEEIERQFRELARAKDNDIVFYDVPLLFETGADKRTDYNWLITCDEDVRVRRVMDRDGTDAESVKKRISAQMPEAKKRELSDEIIDNSGTVEDLYKKVDRLIKKYQNKK